MRVIIGVAFMVVPCFYRGRTECVVQRLGVRLFVDPSTNSVEHVTLNLNGLVAEGGVVE